MIKFKVTARIESRGNRHKVICGPAFIGTILQKERTYKLALDGLSSKWTYSKTQYSSLEAAVKGLTEPDKFN